ncbi:MAG: regulatory protein RecX [Bacillota bacterium]|jgi:SOS response regulatory protein OraA/RecX
MLSYVKGSSNYKKKYLSDFKEIRSAALRYLNQRHYSEKGLREKLLKRLDPQEQEELMPVLDQVIMDLMERRFIDEEKMVESWVYYRTDHVPRSKCFVRQELLNKGVCPDILDNVLDDFYQDMTEEEVLRRIFCKEALREPEDEEQKERFWKRLINRLGRKGFSFEKIIALVEEKRNQG